MEYIQKVFDIYKQMLRIQKRDYQFDILQTIQRQTYVCLIPLLPAQEKITNEIDERCASLGI